MKADGKKRPESQRQQQVRQTGRGRWSRRVDRFITAERTFSEKCFIESEKQIVAINDGRVISYEQTYSRSGVGSVYYPLAGLDVSSPGQYDGLLREVAAQPQATGQVMNDGKRHGYSLDKLIFMLSQPAVQFVVQLVVRPLRFGRDLPRL
jgi:hypothetical protein